MSTKAFSLIEVLVFTTILSIVLVAATSVTVVSLRNMKANEHKILATRYAEELEEWLESEKEENWYLFTEKAVSGLDTEYCFTDLNGWPSQGSCSGFTQIDGHGPAIFQRSITLHKDTSRPESITGFITINWQELNSVQTLKINLVFTLWEK